MQYFVSANGINQPVLMPAFKGELTVVIAGLALGGAERIVLDWATRVYPKWKVHLIVLRDHQQEWPIPNFIRITRMHNQNVIERLKILGRMIVADGNPVCVAHLLRRTERDALTSQGVFVVPVLHNAQAGWLEPAEDLLGEEHVIPVSHSAAAELAATEWTGTSTVIHHIPPRRKFDGGARAKFRNAWNIPQGATVIGMIGAVKPQKDYPYALRILKTFLEKQDAYLVILGGPVGKNGKSAWQQFIAELDQLGIRNRVASPQFVPDATQCLPAFDVVLSTSHYEGLSMTTVEALANSVPVVTSAVGGQGEVSSDGLYLVPKTAPLNDWVAAIETALTTPASKPSWVSFPSYRLWTLATLARPVKKTKKMLFVTQNLNSGGAQRSLTNLALAINSQADIQVAVAGNSTAAYFLDQLQQGKVRVFRTAETRDAFDHAEALVRKICAENISTVCFWNLDSKIKMLLVKALRFTNVKFVDVSPGDNSFSELSELSEFSTRIAFPEADYYARLNHMVLKYAGPRPAHYKGPVSIIPNGVPTASMVKSSYELQGSPKVVINGRIVPNKFVVEIIEAMSLVRQVMPDAELHIYGAVEPRHEDYGKRVFALAEEVGDGKVFFHGLHFEARAELCRYDAYAVLGFDQGCPNALLEALAAGMPAVANDNGGTREQIINRETGMLIPSCSPQELASALLEVLSNRELAQRIGQQGQAHVLNHFSMQAMSKNYLELFGVKRSWASFSRYLKACFNQLFATIRRNDNVEIEIASS